MLKPVRNARSPSWRCAPRNSESITLSNYPNYSSTHGRRLFCLNQLGTNQVTPHCLSEIRGVFVITCVRDISSSVRYDAGTRPKFSVDMCFRKKGELSKFLCVARFSKRGPQPWHEPISFSRTKQISSGRKPSRLLTGRFVYTRGDKTSCNGSPPLEYWSHRNDYIWDILVKHFRSEFNAGLTDTQFISKSTADYADDIIFPSPKLPPFWYPPLVARKLTIAPIPK